MFSYTLIYQPKYRKYVDQCVFFRHSGCFLLLGQHLKYIAHASLELLFQTKWLRRVQGSICLTRKIWRSDSLTDEFVADQRSYKEKQTTFRGFMTFDRHFHSSLLRPDPMGSSQCRARCDKPQELEVESIVARASLPDEALLEMSQLMLLQGAWYRKDGAKIGDLIADYFLWDVKYKMTQMISPLKLSENLLEMELDGQIWEAQVLLDAQPSITWADGDVWLLKWVRGIDVGRHERPATYARQGQHRKWCIALGTCPRRAWSTTNCEETKGTATPPSEWRGFHKPPSILCKPGFLGIMAAGPRPVHSV